MSESTVQTIPQMFFARAKASAGREALKWKEGGSWRTMNWQELEQMVREVARGLCDWIQPGDKVCLLAENRPEWWVADLATQCLAAASAPIYPTNPSKDIAYILNDCQCSLLFVSSAAQLDKIRKLKAEDRTAALQRVVVFDEVDADEDWVVPLAEVRKRNADVADPIAERGAQQKPEDLATLIYTSGTTGEPKGVMLTHRNLVSNTLGAEVVLGHLVQQMDDRQMLSFLPLSHSFERTVGYYVAIHYDFKVAFAESALKLVDNMSEIHPTLLVSVPRIYEKLYGKVMEGAAHGLKKKLVGWAICVGKQHAEYRLNDRPVPGLLGLKYPEEYGGRWKYTTCQGDVERAICSCSQAACADERPTPSGSLSTEFRQKKCTGPQT